MRAFHCRAVINLGRKDSTLKKRTFILAVGCTVLAAVLVALFVWLEFDFGIKDWLPPTTRQINHATEALESLSLNRDEMQRVDAYSLPEGWIERVYLQPEKIDAVVDYFAGLNLSSNFPEDPNEYSGMSIVIVFTFEDDTEITLNHFGNAFLGVWTDGRIVWFRMSYYEASALDLLLQGLPSDKEHE